MSTVLSNGYTLPDTGDKGSIFFPALEVNIQRLNDHTHDGNNSEKLNPEALTSVVQAISSADWIVSGVGYEQTKTVAGVDLDNASMQFVVNGGTYDKYLWNTEIKKLSSTQYTIYSSDNTLNAIAYFK